MSPFFGGVIKTFQQNTYDVKSMYNVYTAGGNQNYRRVKTEKCQWFVQLWNKGLDEKSLQLHDERNLFYNKDFKQGFIRSPAALNTLKLEFIPTSADCISQQLLC